MTQGVPVFAMTLALVSGLAAAEPVQLEIPIGQVWDALGTRTTGDHAVSLHLYDEGGAWLLASDEVTVNFDTTPSVGVFELEHTALGDVAGYSIALDFGPTMHGTAPMDMSALAACPSSPVEPVLYTPDADLDGWGGHARFTVVVVSAAWTAIFAEQLGFGCETTAPPTGMGEAGQDCDDSLNSVHPGAPEICDGADNDCDGLEDEDGDAFGVAGYADLDNDGWGAGPSLTTCLPGQMAPVDGDCDDSSANVFPGRTELCGSRDMNCDGDPTAGAVNAPSWYPDADEDGFGVWSWSPIEQCQQPDGYSADTTDCDDTEPTINPGAVEVCNERDDDCDGRVDVGAVDTEAVWRDDDGDGWGSGALRHLCDPDDGWAPIDGDCDDDDPAVNPGATDDDNDPTDWDCDGAYAWVEWEDDDSGTDTASVDDDPSRDGGCATGTAPKTIALTLAIVLGTRRRRRRGA